MSGTEMLADLQSKGYRLWTNGEKLEVRGPQPTQELVDALKASKPMLMETLKTDEITFAISVFEMARARFDTKPFDPDEHPPPPGITAHAGTDKVRFYRSGDGWQECWPRDFKVYEGGRK